MTWARLDDGFPEHPKVIELTDRAFRVHVVGICYCAKNLTDGYLPKAALRRIGASSSKVAELVEGGLWSVKDGGGYFIHDYLDWNPSAEKVLKDRAKSSERQARHRANLNGSSEIEATDYEEIARRDDYICYICRREVERKHWSFDHVVPLSLGGTHTWGNLRLVHGKCNSAKNNRHPDSEECHAVTNALRTDTSQRVDNAVPSRPLEVQVLKDGPNGLVELASSTADVKVVYDYWRVKCGKTRSTYDTISTKRREKIKTRLKEFSVADLCLAIDGVVMDPWGERSQHNDITVVLKSREQVERFLEIASADGNVEAAAYSARLSAFYAEKRGLEVIPGGRIGE